MNATDTTDAATDVVDRYIAMWNETDPQRRRALVAATCTSSISYRDPVAQSDGLDEVDAMIASVQERFVGQIA